MEAGLVAEDLEGGLHVGRQGSRHRDLVLGDRVLEPQQLGVEGLAVQQGTLGAVDLVPEQGEAPVCELDADLVPAASLQAHFHHGVARQALHHPVVGDGFLGPRREAFAPGAPADLGDGHLQGLGVLDEVPGQGAAVLWQLPHQHGAVDPLEAVQLEVLLEPVEGLGGLGEHQHAAGEAVQAVDDEEVEALEAPAPVGLRDGLGQARLAALLRGHRQEARRLVHEQQVVVLPQGLVGPTLQLAGGGEHLVDPLRVEGDLHGVPGLQAQAVLLGHLPVDGDAATVDEALRLPVADDQHPVQLRSQGRALLLRLPFPFDLRHGAPPHRPASLQRQADSQQTMDGRHPLGKRCIRPSTEVEVRPPRARRVNPRSSAPPAARELPECPDGRRGGRPGPPPLLDPAAAISSRFWRNRRP